jgi:hypothetical protein
MIALVEIVGTAATEEEEEDAAMTTAVVDTALAPDMEAAIAMAGTETADTVVESAVETDATANATTTDMAVAALIAMHPVEVVMTAIVVARVVAEATVVTVATVVLTIDTAAAILDAMTAVLEMAAMVAAAKQQLHLPQAATPMLVVVAEATTIAVIIGLHVMKHLADLLRLQASGVEPTPSIAHHQHLSSSSSLFSSTSQLASASDFAVAYTLSLGLRLRFLHDPQYFGRYTLPKMVLSGFHLDDSARRRFPRYVSIVSKHLAKVFGTAPFL